MKVERLHLGKKRVIVGIRLDGYAKELLDWAVVKVADPGDSVLAIHVCKNSGAFSVHWIISAPCPNELESFRCFVSHVYSRKRGTVF